MAKKGIFLEDSAQLANYFCDNLPLLSQLCSSRQHLQREWALKGFMNPCALQGQWSAQAANLSVEQLTRKYPYYVLHKSKRLHSISALDKIRYSED